MKNILFFALILLQTVAKSQPQEIPANIDIHKNVLTIANYSSDEVCGLVNSSRSEGGIEDLVEVMDSTGAYDLGSGFVYEYGGEKYVITCEHVIFKAGRIVGYDRNYKEHELELVGGDTFYDVAVLRFTNPTDAAKWRGVRFDFTPQKNTEVYAAGYWKWNGDVSIVSGNLTSEDARLTDKKLPIVKIGFVESNALIDSGYSGGVLYNLEGQVIGMHNSVDIGKKRSYALQSTIIKRIVHDILNRNTDEVQRAFSGIQFSQNMAGGAVLIDKILDKSPAKKYRKQLKGKTLIAINGNSVKDIYDVLKIMENTPPYEVIKLEISEHNCIDEVTFTTKLLDTTYLKAIARHAVREHEGDDFIDIRVIKGVVTVITDKQIKEVAKTAGLINNRVYCINNLAQLGSLVRIFSLHGELRIGIDEEFRKGRWIYFSENDDRRVLYY